MGLLSLAMPALTYLGLREGSRQLADTYRKQLAYAGSPSYNDLNDKLMMAKVDTNRIKSPIMPGAATYLQYGPFPELNIAVESLLQDKARGLLDMVRGR